MQVGRLLTDRVIIKPDKPREKYGLIVIPKSAKQRPSKGTILAHGPGRNHVSGKVIPCDFNVGDKAYFGEYAGFQVELDGEDVIVMRESDVMAVESN